MLVETEDQVEPLAVVTTDLRLNESRYAALPNIMKAKKKPLDEKTPTDFGVDTAPRLKILKTEEPSAARPACYKQERENTIMAILLFFWQITTTLTFPTRRPRR